jgi:2-hydroxy-3-keto-5-methylthiopentenyl-1-phosphate phosphatase
MIDWHIVCDFDGTITRTDVIDSILQRFADPSWEAIENAWLAGDIGSRECLSRQLSQVKATPTQLLDLFDNIEQAIARILARHYVNLLPILANRLRQVDHSRWRIDFPHASDACRTAAGNCKCRSAPMARRVLVIGDGQSDMCVASTADFVFAKDRLAEHCERNNIAYARFDSFAELPALLALLPSVSAANTRSFNLDTQELFHHV